MEVILRADVHKLGTVGKVVKVKDGYARNFLIPQKIVKTFFLQLLIWDMYLMTARHQLI